jgi:hypothetical protein
MKIGKILLGYNRPDHLEKTVSALAEADELDKDIILYLDGPGDQKAHEAQTEILSRITVKYSIPTLMSVQNRGLKGAVINAIDHQFNAVGVDAVIVIEDDCVPRPGFFEFMRHYLTLHERDSSIRSVCGYQFPNLSDDQNIMVRGIRSSRFIPWGWGTWKKEWSEYEENLDKLLETVPPTPPLPKDVEEFLARRHERRSESWCINWTLHHLLSRTESILPTRTLIDNIGVDGTGVHCGISDVFSHDTQQKEIRPVKIVDFTEAETDHNLDQAICRQMELHWNKTMFVNLHNNEKR